MNPYKTNIAGKEAIFTDECIKIGNLTLPYEKMSNIKFRNGENQGFIFDYEGRNLFIPCPDEEKNAMMSFFQIVTLKDKERREEEERRKREEELLKKQQEEQDTLNTLDILSSNIPDNADTIKNDAEEISQNIVNPNLMQAQAVNQEPVQQNIQPELPQQPMPQQNNQAPQIEIKPFWKTGRLVMGIISMVLFVLITFQSCAAGLSNAIEESSSISGSAGFFLGLFMLVGGIVGVATRKSVKKGGCIASAILYAIGSLFGALEWNSTYGDLKVWVVISILFSIFYMFCAIKTQNPNKSKKPIVGYVIYGLILLLTIGGIALGGNNTDNSGTTGDTTSNEAVSADEQAEESKYPMTIEDNEYFTLEILSEDYDSIFGEEIKCKFTNKTDKPVTFSSENIVLNDNTTIDASMMFNAEANTNNNDSFIIGTEYYDEVKDNPVKITVKYRMYDSDEWEDITEGSFDFTIE